MRHMMMVFLFGVVVGGVGTSGFLITAGDPYEYATLRDYPCTEIKAGRRPPPDTMVPGQENPCFVRYWRWWL